MNPPTRRPWPLGRDERDRDRAKEDRGQAQRNRERKRKRERERERRTLKHTPTHTEREIEIETETETIEDLSSLVVIYVESPSSPPVECWPSDPSQKRHVQRAREKRDGDQRQVQLDCP